MIEREQLRVGMVLSLPWDDTTYYYKVLCVFPASDSDWAVLSYLSGFPEGPELHQVPLFVNSPLHLKGGIFSRPEPEGDVEPTTLTPVSKYMERFSCDVTNSE